MEFFQILASALSGGTILLFGMLGGILRVGSHELGDRRIHVTRSDNRLVAHKPGIHGSVCLPVSWLQPFSVFYAFICHAEGRPMVSGLAINFVGTGAVWFWEPTCQI